MINTTNIEQAKKQIRLAGEKKEKPIIVQAQDYDFNRAIIEYGKFDVLLSPEAKAGKDTLKKINSGLDYILAETAAKKGISIGIDMRELASLDKQAKARKLTKLIQNIKLCKKAKAKLALLNYKDKTDAIYFLLSLGASTSQAKEALHF